MQIVFTAKSVKKKNQTTAKITKHSICFVTMERNALFSYTPIIFIELFFIKLPLSVRQLIFRKNENIMK